MGDHVHHKHLNIYSNCIICLCKLKTSWYNRWKPLYLTPAKVVIVNTGNWRGKYDAHRPMSKKAAMNKTKRTFPIRANNLLSQNVLHTAFTHLLFLSFPGFLLLQFYLLWKKFLHCLVRNKGVQIPEGKEKEEEHQCITRMNLQTNINGIFQEHLKHLDFSI